MVTIGGGSCGVSRVRWGNAHAHLRISTPSAEPLLSGGGKIVHAQIFKGGTSFFGPGFFRLSAPRKRPNGRPGAHHRSGYARIASAIICRTSPRLKPSRLRRRRQTPNLIPRPRPIAVRSLQAVGRANEPHRRTDRPPRTAAPTQPPEPQAAFLRTNQRP